MTDQVPIKAIGAIPHIDANALLGRMVLTTTFYTGGVWQLWFANEGRLIPLEIEFAAEGLYFGDVAAQPHDLYLRALDLIARYASFDGIRRPLVGICDDIYNLGASIAKIDQVTAHQKVAGGQAMRMVVTEVEYMAVRCRSVFDSIQKILRFLWLQAHFIEDGATSTRELPESFGDMVLEKLKPQTAQELVKRYAIPEPLAMAYAHHAPFFADLKRVRDAFVHKSARTPPIFVMENGAYIARSLPLFSSITMWRDEEIKPNDLVPLRPALGAMIHRTLLAAEELVVAYSQVVALGAPICPNHRLYLRAHSGPVLAEVLAHANERYSARQSAGGPG